MTSFPVEDVPSIVPLADKQPVFSGYPDFFVHKLDPTVFNIFCDRVTFGLPYEIHVQVAKHLTKDWYHCINSLTAPGRYRLRFNQPFASHNELYCVVHFIAHALRFDSTVLEYKVYHNVPIRGARYLELALSFECGLGPDGASKRRERAYVPSWDLAFASPANNEARTVTAAHLAEEIDHRARNVCQGCPWKSTAVISQAASSGMPEAPKQLEKSVAGEKSTMADDMAGKAKEDVQPPVIAPNAGLPIAVGELHIHELLYVALRAAPNNEMILKDMFDWFRAHAPNKEKPQNAIRWTLSFNKAFRFGIRLATAERARALWCSLTPDAIENGIGPTTAFRGVSHRTRQLLRDQARASAAREKPDMT